MAAPHSPEGKPMPPVPTSIPEVVDELSGSSMLGFPVYEAGHVPDKHMRSSTYLQIPSTTPRATEMPESYRKQFIDAPEDPIDATRSEQVITPVRLPRNPNILPSPARPDPFDKLALGGIRRRLFERRYLRRPGEKLDEAERTQKFYSSLGERALIKAGVLHGPQNPTPPAAEGLVQKRRHKRVMSHSEELGGVHGTRDMVDWAHQELEKKRRPKHDRKAPGHEDRLRRIEEAKRIPRERLYNSGQKFLAGEITEAQYKAAQEEYKNAGRTITDAIQLPYHAHRTKYEKKVIRKDNALTEKILETTETGFNARRREKNLAKWEKKVENAPDKAQKRIEKMERKVARKEKYKRGAKKVGRGTKKAVVGTIKAPIRVGSKVKQAWKSRPHKMARALDATERFAKRADALMMKYNPVEVIGKVMLKGAVGLEFVHDKAKETINNRRTK